MRTLKGFIRVMGGRQVSPWSVELVFKREGKIHIQTLSGKVYAIDGDAEPVLQLLESTIEPLIGE